MLIQKTYVLLVGDSEAVKKVINVSLRKLLGVCEASKVAVDVVVLLDRLDNISVSLHFQSLLCKNGVFVCK